MLKKMLATLPLMKLLLFALATSAVAFGQGPAILVAGLTQAVALAASPTTPANWFSNHGCTGALNGLVPLRRAVATLSKAWANVWLEVGSLKKYGEAAKFTPCGRWRARWPA